MSGFHLFPGGIHPQEGINGKAVTAGMALKTLEAPSRVTIPLKQHMGAPCEPTVVKGDRVLVGQVIGKPVGRMSAAVHASVSGTVVSVSRCILADGHLTECVIIDNDFREEWVPLAPVPDVETLTPQAFSELIRQAGIVGLGGATFPTAVKMLPPDGKDIDTLILNGAECEPYLSADHRLMVESPDVILDGASLVMRVLGIPKAIVGIENNKPDAIEKMRAAASAHSGIEVRALPTRYPQGGEKQLTYALTRRKVRTGGLPLDCGVIVTNVATAYAISEALRKGRPLIERAVTVGGSVKKPGNFVARIGASVDSLLDAAEGLLPESKMLICGGPMMGLAISRTDIPVTKGTSGVIALEAEVVHYEEGPCIHCGRCVQACPMRLVPATIDRYMRKDMYEEAEKAGAMNCLECGACTWACPARRNLTQSCRVCKKKVNDRRAKERAEQEAQKRADEAKKAAEAAAVAQTASAEAPHQTAEGKRGDVPPTPKKEG